MKSTHQIVLAAAVLGSAAVSSAQAGSIVKITSLPYTINASGEYELDSDLTAPSGDNGITIASGVNNVVISLNGHMMFGSGPFTYGVVCLNSNNVTVKGGFISGFGVGVGLKGSEFRVNGLHVDATSTGVNLNASNSLVDNCVIVSSGSNPNTIGVFIVTNCEVRDCHIYGFGSGVLSGSEQGYNSVIHCFLTNCDTGLILFGTDVYQGNVTTKSFTASFSGGNAVGLENGGN